MGVAPKPNIEKHELTKSQNFLDWRGLVTRSNPDGTTILQPAPLRGWSGAMALDPVEWTLEDRQPKICRWSVEREHDAREIYERSKKFAAAGLTHSHTSIIIQPKN